MATPLISIVVPNYNHARFLNERFQSILNQTYSYYELIILDDNSSDNSLEIIKKYKNDSHVSHVVINEECSGSPFLQWNRGFKLSKGDLIWIAESDDSCSPHFLERLVSQHCSNNATLSFCRSQQMDEKGRLHATLQNNIYKDSLWDGKDFIETFLGKCNIIANASSVLFNRNNLPYISDDYLNYRGAGDWLFWIEIAKRGKVCFCSESLNYWRKHNDNTTVICDKNGENYYGMKKINDYLFNERLISKTLYSNNVYSNINKILNRKFESENVRRELLRIWGYNYSFKTKHFASRILNKLEWLLWS